MFKNSNLLVTLILATSITTFEARLAKSPLKIETYGCPEKCLIAFRCSPYFSEELLWGLVDGICKVYANGCIYSSAKCLRQNNCLPPIIDSNQAQCQQYCASGCDTLPESRVCGWFPKLSPTGEPEEEKFEFKNQCALDEWSCKNSRPYGSASPGACT